MRRVRVRGRLYLHHVRVAERDGDAVVGPDKGLQLLHGCGLLERLAVGARPLGEDEQRRPRGVGRALLDPRDALALRVGVLAVDEDGHHGDGRVAKELEVGLRYDKRGGAVIEGIQRVSKPGLRQYFRAKEIPKVRGGLGVMILSTSNGVMTDRSAREANVGGEPICSVW